MNYSNLSSKWNSTVLHSATPTVCECLLAHNVPAVTDTVCHKLRWQLDRQYTCNVILRRLCASFVAAEDLRVCLALGINHVKRLRHIILSSVVCYHYHIFPHYHINGMFFSGKKVIEHKMCVLIFVCNISHSKNWARYDQKCILVFVWSTCDYCQILMKL
jgi:small basic protein